MLKRKVIIIILLSPSNKCPCAYEQSMYNLSPAVKVEPFKLKLCQQGCSSFNDVLYLLCLQLKISGHTYYEENRNDPCLCCCAVNVCFSRLEGNVNDNRTETFRRNKPSLVKVWNNPPLCVSSTIMHSVFQATLLIYEKNVVETT